MNFIKKIGADQCKLFVNWEPIETKVWSVQACDLKLVFKRGKEQTNISSAQNVSRSVRPMDIKKIKFKPKENENFPYSRTCTFFMKDGKAKSKTATVSIVKFTGGKDQEIGRAEINLADFIGEEWVTK